MASRGWHWGARSLEQAEDLAWALADPVDYPLGPLWRDGRMELDISAFESWMQERGWILSNLGPAGCMWMKRMGAECQAPSQKDVGHLWVELHRWGAEREAQCLADVCAEDANASQAGGRL